MNPNVGLTIGVVCGVRVEEVADPLMSPSPDGRIPERQVGPCRDRAPLVVVGCDSAWHDSLGRRQHFCLDRTSLPWKGGLENRGAVDGADSEVTTVRKDDLARDECQCECDQAHELVTTVSTVAVEICAVTREAVMESVK